MTRPSSSVASSIAWLVGALVVLQAASAFAGAPVTLKRDLASGPQITLGDLFDGAGDAAPVVVGAGAPVGLNAVLDAGVVARIAHSNGLDWDNASGIRRIIVRSLPTAPTAAASRASQMVQVLTYARSLMAGELIKPEDLTFAQIPAFQAPQEAPREANDVIGKVARIPLRSGAPVSVRDVSNAQVIKRDDLIEVAYHADGISLVLQAKAMSAAAVGDTLNVMNTTSNKVIQAVAVGPDQAVVGPEAAQIKSAAYPNLSSQFADNR
jgi:flagella basal body P-ring formation protein FlgA